MPLADRRGLRLVAGAFVILAVVASLLSVNTFPAITNDAVVYIEYSRDLGEGGWVEDGFRQVGYPAFLAAVRGLADVVGAEPLLATALLQRLLLVCAGIVAFRAWGWWSLPLLAYLFTPATIAYSNFILTEALALPVAVLLVVAALAYIRGLSSGRDGDRPLLLWGGLATLGAVFLLTVRFTFAVYGAIPLVIALASWKTPHRRLGVGLLAAFVVMSGAFAVFATMENDAELGHATPSAHAGHTAYFYAWQHVFGIEENRADPVLAEFYDDGVVYDFERQLTRDQVPYAERDELFEAEISAMLAAAGRSEQGSRLASMAWSLAGGRLHDLAGVVHGILNRTDADVERWTYLNSFAIENGPQAFADEYNDGRLPEAIVTNRSGVLLQGPDSQSWMMLLVPLSLIVMTIGLRHPASRWPSVLGLLVVVSTAVGLGWIRADNFRFLLVSSGFGIAVATSVLPELIRIWSTRPLEPPCTMV